jgi:31-O-methyltransferase
LREPKQVARRPEWCTLLTHEDLAQLGPIVREIVDEGEYDGAWTASARQSVVFDVGANVGVSAIHFVLDFDVSMVYAFEPVPALAATLRRNLAACGVPKDRVRVLERPASSSTRPVEVVYYPKAAGMSGLYADAESEAALSVAYLRNCGLSAEDAYDLAADRFSYVERTTVTATTVSSVIEAERVDRIDLLKIDVEKSELDVIDGIDEGHWPLVKNLVVEIHDIDGRVASLAERLRARGFVVSCDQSELLRGTEVYTLWATLKGELDA